MRALLQTADDILRRRSLSRQEITQASVTFSTLVPLIGCVIAFGALYGAAMGLYRAFNGLVDWETQVAYAAIKTPLLLIVAFLVALPSCFVLGALLGLRDDFGQAVRALIASQAALAIVLASLAPLTLLFYASSSDYRQALVLNGAMFAIASLVGQGLLRWHFRPLIARNSRHRQLLIAWGVVYVFVAVQLAWLLRPFVGSRGMEVTFFRAEAWDNAYVQVARLVWRTLFGS